MEPISIYTTRNGIVGTFDVSPTVRDETLLVRYEQLDLSVLYSSYASCFHSLLYTSFSSPFRPLNGFFVRRFRAKLPQQTKQWRTLKQIKRADKEDESSLPAGRGRLQPSSLAAGPLVHLQTILHQSKSFKNVYKWLVGLLYNNHRWVSHIYIESSTLYCTQLGRRGRKCWNRQLTQRRKMIEREKRVPDRLLSRVFFVCGLHLTRRTNGVAEAEGVLLSLL